MLCMNSNCKFVYSFYKQMPIVLFNFSVMTEYKTLSDAPEYGGSTCVTFPFLKDEDDIDYNDCDDEEENYGGGDGDTVMIL